MRGAAMIRVAVVTPYYQEDAGVLARALASAFAQDLPPDIAIDLFVVDDASPRPAEVELAGLSETQRARITLIHQENGGPGAARNTALDRIDPATYRYVAFLDSDDSWAPTHIAEAVAALERGYDFYFCDHTRFDTEISYFAEEDGGRQTQRWRDAPGPEVLVLSPDGPLLHIAQPDIFEAFLREYLSQTSTVVYRLGKAPGQRFDTTLRKAGEDLLFWLTLLNRGAETVVNYRANVHCGEGINLYASAYDFASPKVVERVGYILLTNIKISETLRGATRDPGHIDMLVTRYTRAYGYLFIRSLLRGQRPNLDLWRRIFRAAPHRALLVPYFFLSVLPNRATETDVW